MDWGTFLSQLPIVVIVIVGVPAVLVAYIVGTEYLVRLLPDAFRPRVRPWIWVGPALIFVFGFLILPAILTAKTSLESGAGDFVGLQNYQRQLGDFPTGGAWIAIRNNVYWLKSLIFMPMAISAVALGVIWKFMYWYQPPGVPQTGTVNAILGIFHQDPRIWVQDPSVDNFAIIAAATWGITGFAMVILSAALKGIPADLLEAARVDGAGEITIFRRVIFPLMMPTVVVVGTTLVIFALKAFDVVYVMTGGNFETDVLANRMYKLLFFSGNQGGAAAVAMILLAAVVPVLIFNLRQFRAVEARR